MTTSGQEFQKFLNLQRADYQRALPEKMDQILAAWRAVAAGTEVAQPLAELDRLAHTLAGTAGTLGFREVGLAAGALELLLQPARQAGTVLTAAQRSEVALAIAALQDSLPQS